MSEAMPPDEQDPNVVRREERRKAFRERSQNELKRETWEKFPELGIERIRVLAGWLYRHIAPTAESQWTVPLTFVADPPRHVYAAPPSLPR